MPANVISMSNAVMDQTLNSAAENPEQILACDENVPESERAQRRDELNAQEQAAHQSRTQQLLARLQEIKVHVREESRTLSFLEKGELVAWLTDVGRLRRRTVADVLGMSMSAVGVAKWKALADHPCGAARGGCEGVAGCTHKRGAALLHVLVSRVLEKMP